MFEKKMKFQENDERITSYEWFNHFKIIKNKCEINCEWNICEYVK